MIAALLLAAFARALRLGLAGVMVVVAGRGAVLAVRFVIVVLFLCYVYTYLSRVLRPCTALRGIGRVYRLLRSLMKPRAPETGA